MVADPDHRRRQYWRDPEKFRQLARNRYAATPEVFQARTKRYRETNQAAYRETVKKQNLRQYGLTPIDFDEMLVAQEGVCAICRKPPTGGSARYLVLGVDHDHSLANREESIRGLLCWHCNVMIGHARDNPSVLRAAAEYLDA